ncbi:MAG: hypothetical protein GX060_00500 [Firmicutes bacterium]|nr:hypothetical protein [Bacillota bacterium]
MFKRLKERLPKKKTQAELDEHYRKMEEIQLEPGDLPAMIIAAFLTLGIPLLLIAGLIYGAIYLLFLR